MANKHESRLETIIGATIQVAGEYLAERNTSVCSILVNNALALYEDFRKANLVKDSTLYDQLVLGCIKLAVLESLDDLKDVRDQNDLSWRFKDGFWRKIEAVKELNTPDFYFVKLDILDTDNVLSYTSSIITSPKILPEYQKWCEYANVIKCYLDTFKTGRNKGRDLKEEEQEILNEFKQKFGWDKKGYLSQKKTKELPYNK